MRPRQNLRDYHHNSHPPYQSINHNPNLLQQRQQSMIPPHPPSGTPPLLGPAPRNSATRVIQPPLPSPDLISELIKLGLNPEDMAKQSNRPADLLRNLQAILGKREAADLLQKLPLNELFMQSPSEFARGATMEVGGGSRDSVICGPSGVAGPQSGPTSFINNINNGNANRQEQDAHYPNHQANHHQQFRIPATNPTTVHNSPQQQQHKQSVLSIHQQQQQQQHQDQANRRMNDQQHMMTSASGSSYGNLNDMSGRIIPTSSIESHNSNIFNRRKPSPPVNSYTIPSASSAPRALNIVDSLGTSSGGSHTGQLDSNMYDNPAFQQHNVSSTNQQQSLIRHQQLQKLLRSAASGPPKTNMPLPTPNLSTRNDLHASGQRTSISNLAQMQRQMTSPNATSAISTPQQALSSVPKSLLNLAACTSKSPPVTNNVASIGKSHRTFQSNYSACSASNSVNNPTPNNKAATPRQVGNSNSAFNNRIQNSVDSTNLLHQMISRSNQAKSSNQGPNKNSQNTNTLTSLLSDDQRTIRPNTGQPNSHQPSNVTKSSNQIPFKRQPQSTSDTNAVQRDPKSKEAYLAYLQERAAKAGVSIGEISQGSARQDNLSQPRSQSPEVSANSARYSAPNSNTKDNEVRNDLSLLYPPIELASSSQRQVSLLAAGLNLSEGVDVITDEVRKIIQQECNIIYECKGCSNLFRSLANLVKHKRQFCDNSNIERAYSELNKQFLNNALSTEMPNTSRIPVAIDQSKIQSTMSGDSRDSSILDPRSSEHLNASISIGSQKYNLRGRRIDSTPDTPCQVKSTRLTRSHDRKEQTPSTDAQITSDRNISPHQTNLSRLLQSQPKSIQPTSKESALMDALNMPNPVSNRRSVMKNSRNCSVNEINEQLVKNSSLAKTLLNENAKSMNSGSPAMQLARAVAQQPKAGPKRKLLEDCIQKVKRDKMVTEEEEDSREARCSQQDMKKLDHMSQFRDPLAIDDSDADSDALVMDLDEPSSTPRSRRKESRDSRAEDDRIYESLPSNRINTSSALLKALTRPVDSKSTCVGNVKSDIDKASSVSERPSEVQNVSPTAVRSTGTLQNSLSETAVSEDSGSSTSAVDNDLEVVPPSPLFDKYTCEMCETDLEDQSSLLAHIMEEHKKENKIYPCLFCSFTFITLENVCRHIIDIHRKTKTQVGHLKEVVRSRSFISQDFMTCSDCPPALLKTGEENSDHEEEAEISLTEKASPDMIETRRSSSVLSDSAATKQILEDTLAMVSDSTSPNAANRYNSSDRLTQIISRTRSSDKTLESLTSDENKATEQPETIVDDNEDPLCDSLMNNLTEHLAILESQEAEIEAEQRRRQQAVASRANGEIQVDGGPFKLKQEPLSNVEQALCDDEASEVHLESRNQQTTPSRGKHIVAGQPFHTEEAHNSDQEEEGDGEEEDLDLAEQESRDANPEDNSAYDEDIDEPDEVESDGSEYNQDHQESDEGESFTPDYSEFVDNEAEDFHDESGGQHQKGLGVRISSRVSSRRDHKRRRSSRNDDDDDDIEAHERRHKGDTDLSPSLASDKSESQNFHDVGLAKDGSSHSLDTTSKNSTMEGGCKLKLKTSGLRDVCGGAGSSAIGGQQGSSSADSSSGGIKKLKIQLKAQPDEKSKVYRIVN